MPMYESLSNHTLLQPNKTWVFNENGQCIRPVDANGILTGTINTGDNIYLKKNGCLVYSNKLEIADEAKLRYSNFGSKQSTDTHPRVYLERKKDEMVGIQDDVGGYEKCFSSINNNDGLDAINIIKSEDSFIDESSDAAAQLLAKLEKGNAEYELLIKQGVFFSDIHMDGKGYLDEKDKKIYSEETKRLMANVKKNYTTSDLV